MRVQIRGLLKRHDLNGMWGSTCACEKEGRIGVSLDDGTKVCVKYENIRESEDLDCCAICHDPMFPEQTTTIGCGHEFHSTYPVFFPLSIHLHGSLN